MLLKNCICAIIIKRDCNRYAMKRKVAGGMSGNFRGVCPILNRATEIPSTVSDVLSFYKKLGVCNCVLMTVTRILKSRNSGFFIVIEQETHGNV